MNTEKAELAMEKISQRTAARLREVKGHSGDFIGNSIAANAFEALCVLYKEYRLDDVPDAGPFILKLKQVLNEEYEKLPTAEKNALCGRNLYSAFEQYLCDFTSNRIQAAYQKWVGCDWGPQLGTVSDVMDF